MDTKQEGNPRTEIVGRRDGYCAYLRVGDAPNNTYQMAFPNPVADPHVEWMLRYADNLGKEPSNARFAAASVLDTFNYLLSDHINMEEATRRLRLLRAARSELLNDARTTVST